MERRKFFKNMLGIAALPLIPDFMKEVAPAPASKVAGTLFADLRFFRLGDVVNFHGGQGVVTAVNSLSNELHIIPLRSKTDLGAGPGNTAKWKIGDKPDAPQICYKYYQQTDEPANTHEGQRSN